MPTYMISRCEVEGKKMFAIYPMTNAHGYDSANVEACEGFITDYSLAILFVVNVLRGKVYNP